jgi:hypothetical protein
MGILSLLGRYSKVVGVHLKSNNDETAPKQDQDFAERIRLRHPDLRNEHEKNDLLNKALKRGSAGAARLSSPKSSPYQPVPPNQRLQFVAAAIRFSWTEKSALTSTL